MIFSLTRMAKNPKQMNNTKLARAFTSRLVSKSYLAPRPPIKKVEYLPPGELKFGITPQGISKLTPELFSLPPIKLSFPKWCEDPATLFGNNSIGRHTSFHLAAQLTENRDDSPWRLVEFRSGTAYLNLMFIRNQPKLLEEFGAVTDYFIEHHIHCVTLTANFANFILQITPKDKYEITYGIQNYTSRSVEIPKPRTILIQHFHTDCLIGEYVQFFDLNRAWDPKESERPWQKTTFAPRERP